MCQAGEQWTETDKLSSFILPSDIGKDGPLPLLWIEIDTLFQPASPMTSVFWVEWVGLSKQTFSPNLNKKTWILWKFGVGL
jgi:hypothetical protein